MARKKIARIVLAVLLFILTLVGTRYWWHEKRWRFIIIHHSASEIGNLDYIKKIHIKERGWHDIAYHFVINNGSLGTTMGQLEKSELWESRSANLSTRLDYVNIFGISVVLVGNFDQHEIPLLQKEALLKLLLNLVEEYQISPERIIGHRDIQNTACPGEHLDINLIRQMIRDRLPKK